MAENQRDYGHGRGTCSLPSARATTAREKTVESRTPSVLCLYQRTYVSVISSEIERPPNERPKGAMERGWNRDQHERGFREKTESAGRRPRLATTAITAGTGIGSRSRHTVPRFERFRSCRSRGRRSRSPPPCREPPQPDPLGRLSHQGGGVSAVTGWGRRIGRQQRSGDERRGAAQGVGENERARRTLRKCWRATRKTEERKDGRRRCKRRWLHRLDHGHVGRRTRRGGESRVAKYKDRSR